MVVEMMNAIKGQEKKMKRERKKKKGKEKEEHSESPILTKVVESIGGAVALAVPSGTDDGSGGGGHRSSCVTGGCGSGCGSGVACGAMAFCGDGCETLGAIWEQTREAQTREEQTPAMVEMEVVAAVEEMEETVDAVDVGDVGETDMGETDMDVEVTEVRVNGVKLEVSWDDSLCGELVGCRITSLWRTAARRSAAHYVNLQCNNTSLHK